MKQDAGQKVEIIATGRTGKTTGQMLFLWGKGLTKEIKYKNGVKEWFKDHELRNISNSK